MSLPVEEVQTLNNDDWYIYLTIIKYSSAYWDYYISNIYRTEHELRDWEKRAKSNWVYKVVKCKIF